MPFHVKPPQAEQPAPTPKRRAPAPLIVDNRKGCEVCSLRESWPRLTTPQMPLDGEATADILALGEAPGAEEDQQGRPFVGQAGQTLRAALPRRQLDRIAFANMTRCRPTTRTARDFANRTPTPREIHACSIYLEDDIAVGRFRAILGLGGVPLSHFLGESGITHVHGLKFPVEVAGKVLWYYPTVHPSFVNRTKERGGGGYSPNAPIFENDIRNFFAQVDKWPAPVIEKPAPSDVIIAGSEEEAVGYCAQLGDTIGFDIETNGLRPNTADAAIMTAAASDGKITVAWPVCHPQASNDWGLPLLLELTRSKRWVGHNAAFELAWLHAQSRRAEIPWEPAAGFDDSMVAVRLHQRREVALNLGIATRLYLGTNIKRLSTIRTERIASEPLSEVLPYNGLDAWGCFKVFQQLRPQVDNTTYSHLIETIQSVTAMQLTGLDVDREAATSLLDIWEGRAAVASERAQSIYEVKQYKAALGVEFNIGSNDQVGKALTMVHGKDALPKTPEGNYRTDDATLTKAMPDNPLCRAVVEYRHAKKMLTTYITPLLEAKARFGHDRIYPVYSTCLTKTFRTSCEDPNAQNFPKRRDRELRTPVVPPAGCVWASADFGQLEARVYAMASQDAAFCQSIIEKEDVHSLWLNRILELWPDYINRLAQKVTPNETEAQVRKGGRDIIKSDFTFASFYGSSARNVAERTGLPLDLATQVLGEFWQKYAGAERWMKARRREYNDTATARNLFGVERYGLMMGNEPINTPIQSTAARLVLEAQNEMYRLYKATGDVHLLPRINVHDDLTYALPDDDEVLMVYIEEISKVMTKVRFKWQIVPLMIEWKIGHNWAEMHDVFEFTGDWVRRR